jgi:hypothetical protein
MQSLDKHEFNIKFSVKINKDYRLKTMLNVNLLSALGYLYKIKAIDIIFLRDPINLAYGLSNKIY